MSIIKFDSKDQCPFPADLCVKHHTAVKIQEINKLKFKMKDRLLREIQEIEITLSEPVPEIEIVNLLVARMKRIITELSQTI